MQHELVPTVGVDDGVAEANSVLLVVHNLFRLGLFLGASQEHSRLVQRGSLGHMSKLQSAVVHENYFGAGDATQHSAGWNIHFLRRNRPRLIRSAV